LPEREINVYQYGAIVKDCPDTIFGPMGYDEGPIDKDLWQPMDLWVPITSKRIDLKNSNEPPSKVII
jgi:hypothetical protein